MIGITVDQMKMDYLYRYWHLYSDGGFKRLEDVFLEIVGDDLTVGLS